MPLPLSAIIEAAYVGECNGQTVMNIFHYRVETQSSIADVGAEVLVFRQAFGSLGGGSMLAAYLLCMPTNYTLTRVTAQPIYPTRYRRNTQGNEVAGTGSAAALTSNLQASITLTTDLAGRNQNGGKRLLLPGDGFLDGNLVDAQFDALGTLGAAMILPVTAGSGGGIYNACLFHRPPSVGQYTDITGFIVQRSVRVMRRRTVGLGI
jgi:hypothetical protein